MTEQDDHGVASGCGGGSGGYDRCQEAIHTLYHFLDGELTPLRRQEIAKHLDECRPCLGAFDFEADLKLVIARQCRDQVPEALRRRVLHALWEASGKPVGSEDLWE
jgi:mycothiol system anti-sigma-R factor